MIVSHLPLLSSYNGPSYLLHAVETLYDLYVPLAHIRLIPVIGVWSGPEVEPYYHESNLDQVKRIDPQKFYARLRINVRNDRRLLQFLPLTALGLVSAAEALGWHERYKQDSLGYHALYERLADYARLTEYERKAEYERLERQSDARGLADYARLMEIHAEWTNSEMPVQRLARQLCAQFPGLRDAPMRLETPSSQILTAGMIRAGRWHEGINAPENARTDRLLAKDAPTQTAQALLELFCTQVMLSLATADMMGGFHYQLPIEPKGRPIDLVISSDSTARDVARWLHTYPHRRLPQSRYPEMARREREEWETYFREHPDHDNIFETAPKHWTDEDPAILALHAGIQQMYAEGYEKPLTSEEMLTLAQRHLPDYVPHYPRQYAVTGGMNMEGILLGLMNAWLQERPFLGVTVEEWNLFTASEQVILCGLIVQRRQVLDQATLFQAAARLLLGPAIETFIETFRAQPVRLGKPLAQMGKSLALSGVCALHAPEMRVKIPMDRERDERAWSVEQKLKVIARLFLPVHLTMQVVWQIDRPILGRSTYLTRAGSGNTTRPATRLS